MERKCLGYCEQTFETKILHHVLNFLIVPQQFRAKRKRRKRLRINENALSKFSTKETLRRILFEWLQLNRSVYPYARGSLNRTRTDLLFPYKVMLCPDWSGLHLKHGEVKPYFRSSTSFEKSKLPTKG